MSSPAVRCTEIHKSYGAVSAVRGINLEVARGEVFGLLGPNGAGKTTTMEIIEGLRSPDRGDVEVLGMRWTGDVRALRQRIGVQLQGNYFALNLTVRETVRLFRSFYDRGRDIDEVIGFIDLAEKKNARIITLSEGQRQRCALACALVGSPELIFLDEPTTGLDPQSRHRLWDFVEVFRKEGGTVLTTTHYMEEAERACDRVAIVDHGTVVALGKPSELIQKLEAKQILTVETSGALDVARVKALPGVRDCRVDENRHVIAVNEVGATIGALIAEIERSGNVLLKMSTHQPTLEDVFLGMTGRELREA